MLVGAVSNQAARIQVAAEIDVSVFLDGVEPKMLHGESVVVQGGVCVPGFAEARAVRVQEGYGGRKIEIVVNYVGEVSHCLVAFVDGSCKCAVGGGG